MQESGIEFATRFGHDIGEPLLDVVYEFHRSTFLRHGKQPYLTREFFSEIARTLGESVMFKIALHGSRPVAAAVFFCSPDALYGRYWGADAEYHSLHFETCYHQGIEFCIERGIRRFEPGTQGEHKVARGFSPTLTWSAHYIGDRRFRSGCPRLPGARGCGGRCLRHPGWRTPALSPRPMKTITWLSLTDPPDHFSAEDRALDDPAGLLAAGGDLSTERLLAAYQRGIFPWYSKGQPVLWWSPDPRAVLMPGEFRLTRSLAKTLRNRGFTLLIDQDFLGVIDGCAAPRARSPGTWLVPEMRAAYLQLHRQGHAHSFETWLNGALVGGLYGIRLGNVFFGESMFSLERDASKAALAHLVEYCRVQGVAVIDCQLTSQHLQSMGSRQISRTQFQDLLREHVAMAPVFVQYPRPQCLKKMRFRWRVRSSRLCPIRPSE